MLQMYRKSSIAKYEFNKDVLQHLCGTTSGTVIFKEHCLVNASMNAFRS